VSSPKVNMNPIATMVLGSCVSTDSLGHASSVYRPEISLACTHLRSLLIRRSVLDHPVRDLHRP
jgi:hypothetical protein